MAIKPLIFLTTRSLKNGIVRAVTSGKRLFTLLFALAYYAFLVLRPTGMRGRDPITSGATSVAMAPDVIQCVIFSFFALLTFLLMVSILTPRGGFRQADIDVLFPTPVSPRLVMFMRMFREYLVTLVTPLFLALFGGRSSHMALQRFFAGMKGNAQVVERVSAVAWLLMAFAWVCLGYGIGFYINRSDLRADRNKKVIDITVFIAVLSTIAYFAFRLKSDLSVATLVSCTEAPLIRSVFFSASAATWMAVGAMKQDWLLVSSGIAVFAGVSILGLRMALSQLPYMYDQASVKGFGAGELRVMRRNNDLYGMTAQQARDGKLKIGRFSRWISSFRLTGASALIWKEILLQTRGARFLYYFYGPLQLFMTISPAFMGRDFESLNILRTAGIMIIVMQAMSVLMLTMNSAISGFTELLKRVDFQKPLPFRPSSTVFWEIASKCIPNIFFSLIALPIIVLIRPTLWGFALGSTIFAIGLSLLVSGTVFLVTIAFPDAGDASQRGFRGILIMLGMVILASPGASVFAVLLALTKVNPAIAALPAFALCVGVTLVVSLVAGRLYDSYNPSE